MEQKRAPKLPNSLSAAVLETAALFGTASSSVEERARELLKIAPGQPHALMLMASARRLAGDVAGARDLLRGLATAEPGLAAIQYELGLVSSDLGDTEAAIAAFTRVTDLEPRHPNAWRALADQLSKAGKTEEAGIAYAKHFGGSASGLTLLEKTALGKDDQLPIAENTLREWLNVHATDVWALQMLGSVYIRLGRYEDAEKALSQALEHVPDFSAARWMLAGTFYHRNNWKETLWHVEMLLKKEPENYNYLSLKAYSLLNIGEFESAIARYEALVQKYPTAESWKAYGHALKVVGRQKDSVAAYRKAIALKPDFGQAYWGLATLKTFRFEPADIEAMRTALTENVDLDRNSRSQMHFALGKAFEDANRYALSFEQYKSGNTILRNTVRHSADEMTSFVRRSKSVFTPEFFRERSGWGCASSAPIFVVGLPRSGSTLIEQILASHSLVEGTSELTALDSVAKQLSARDRSRYPELLQKLEAEEVQSAGETYIALADVNRKLHRPFFIDKMPNNFQHLGLLHLILPNAKIIDARRHPLGSGFGIYKHYFQLGNSFAFDLVEIGRFYRDYVELMAHFDAVLPARVHRVFYERMVTSTEQEIRRLLEYCGLSFEETCLRFYETGRGVLTPSSEQVRQPIFTEAIDQWRNYEAWLGPLKSALGDVLDRYPEVPSFDENTQNVQGRWSVSTPIKARMQSWT